MRKFVAKWPKLAKYCVLEKKTLLPVVAVVNIYNMSYFGHCIYRSPKYWKITIEEFADMVSLSLQLSKHPQHHHEYHHHHAVHDHHYHYEYSFQEFADVVSSLQLHKQVNTCTLSPSHSKLKARNCNSVQISTFSDNCWAQVVSYKEEPARINQGRSKQTRPFPFPSGTTW